MRRFVFKLENDLQYRKTLEDMAKSAYQGALRFLNIEKNYLLDLQKKQQELMQAYNIRTGKVAHPDALSFLTRYSLQLINLIEHQEYVIQEKETIAREKFREWNQTRKEVQEMERLKEKEWKEYQGDADKETQKFRREKQEEIR
jgi:flagellar export protein FliJ